MTGFYAPREEHSKKPDIMRQMIEKVSYMPAIELFARQKYQGWDCWGNEVSDNIVFQQAYKDDDKTSYKIILILENRYYLYIYEF